MRHRARTSRGPAGGRVLVAGLVLVLAAGGGGVTVALRSGQGEATRAAPASAAPRDTTTPSPATPSLPPLAATPRAVTASSTAAPVHLTVAAIGVSTGLERLGLLPDRTLAPPSAWPVAGWFAAGARPGDVGPAIIAGHVDSTAGPAVFYRLRDLRVGDPAVVTRADGTTATFVVDEVQQFPKAAFPTEAVYGRVSRPVLRLITCTGDFDRSIRSYTDNLVVSLHLTDTSV